MSASRIATRYAKSLIDLAHEQGKLARIKEDIDTFKAATENRDFLNMLKSPIINTDKKKDIFKALFKDKFDDMTLSFLNIVANKKRESNLVDIMFSFIKQYQAINNISAIQLTTATPLKEEAIEQIKNKFAQSSETAQNIEIETKVDPDLIGGFIVEFGDKLYDASVAHRLEQLKKEFIS